MEGRRSRARRSGSRQGHGASQASSRSGSRMGTSFSGSQLRMRSSLSFAGSKSSLASQSKRNLMSDSQRLQKAAQILDDNGEDVTPQSLLAEIPKKPSAFFWSDSNSQPNDSMFQQSMQSGAGLSQPFSMSVLGTGSLADGSLSSMSVFDSALVQPRAEDSKTAQREAVEGVVGRREEEEDPEEEVRLTLSETPTLTLLHIPGTVPAEEDDPETIRTNNITYQELLKNRPGNDRYSVRGMQTINYAMKTKHTQTIPVGTEERGVSVSTSDMYDTYNDSSDTASSQKDQTLEELSSRAQSRLADHTHLTTDNTHQRNNAAAANKATDNRTLLPGESVFACSVFTESLPVVKASSSRDLPNEKPTLDPTKPNDHPIMKQESLKDHLRVVERAVMMNHMQNKQSLYRNLPVLRDPSLPPSTVDSFHIQAPHLSRLWGFSCPLTHKRHVTALTWNPQNQDIIAVGYGTFTDKEEGQGLICCWSLKNSEFPDRIFHSPSGVCSLSFSSLHPNLLAAGLYNGTVALYNVRSSSHESVLDSRDAMHHHSGAVWQLHWVLRGHSLGEDTRSETLVSVSTDGRLLQWSMRKGFDSSLLLTLKRAVLPKHTATTTKKASKAPGRKQAAQPAPKGAGEGMISQFAPGLGFDFWPKDPNIYLACTEEGLIHKCSCSYNEQVMETYRGHTGPVYCVKWSPFLSDVFISCSADWTVKLWHQDHPTPLHTFHSVQRAIYDIMWSPFHSCMFGSVSEVRVDVWCLDQNMLAPILVHKPFSAASQTTLSFSYNAEVLVVGEASGEVSVYQLRNTPEHQQASALLSVIEPLILEHMIT